MEQFNETFTTHAYLTLFNTGGIEIEICNSGDGLRYRYNYSLQSITDINEAEILFDDSGNPYFLTVSNKKYYLDQFMKINY